MIRSYEAAHGGIVFYRTPSARERIRRMRLAALTVTAAIGFSGGLLQQFHERANHSARLGEAASPIPAGPLASFPR